MSEEPDQSLYVTDEEMCRRIGVKSDRIGPAIRELDKRGVGFPQPDPLFDGKRYWPAVKEWLDARNRLKIGTPEARTRPVRPMPPLRSAS